MARILIAEDEDPIRSLVARALSQDGHAVTTARDGAEALDVLTREGGAFELLLTDIVMPGGLDGFDLSRQAELIRPGIKILYMSGYAATAVARAARGEAARVVHKPFRLDHVLESVEYALCH